MNTCGNCVNWHLSGPLAASRYGFCQVRPDHVMRDSIATSEQATCRIGRFEAKNHGDAIPAPKTAPDAPEAPSEAVKPPF